jgi:dGTPase
MVISSAVWSERRSGRLRHADDARTDDELDYARVVHSGSFRRLQGKTQILSLGDDDFYRTRLTHSLEVAQVAEGISQHLRMTGQDAHLGSNSLLRALGLAHDIGHPPFGHGGELALNYCMRDSGGFEGNAQTLRLLARLEAYTLSHGADLTRRTLLGLLKYPVLRSAALNPAVKPALSAGPTTIGVLDGASAKPAKSCYDCDANVLDWVLSPFSQEDRERFSELSFAESKHAKTMHKSFDCSIMDMADDIAYGVHDLEDAAALNLIDESDWRRAVDELVCSELLNSLAARPVEGVEPTYDGLIAALFGSAGVRKRVIGRLVHSCIAATSVDRVEGFAAPLLSHRLTMREEPRALLQALRDLISNVVIQGARVQHLDFKGQRMVLACFEALVSAPERLLPRSTYVTFDTADGDLRIVSDYVACMTDAGLLRLYDRLFSPRMGTIFDRL